jgi:hypothetical protein
LNYCMLTLLEGFSHGHSKINEMSHSQHSRVHKSSTYCCPLVLKIKEFVSTTSTTMLLCIMFLSYLAIHSWQLPILPSHCHRALIFINGVQLPILREGLHWPINNDALLHS